MDAGGASADAAAGDATGAADVAPEVSSPPGVCVKGAIAVNAMWLAKNSPIKVCGDVTVAAGITLTIEPGTTVELDAGVKIVIANGGRLLAEGTAASKITFTHPATSTSNWGNIIVNGAPGSVETRISYAHFDFNSSAVNAAGGVPALQAAGGTVALDHLSFGNAAAPYIHLDGASFTISDCVFPTAKAPFEPVHGTGGIKSGGHGIFNSCFFGAVMGYNDAVDFTGGNRPGGAIVHFINNVFAGSDDDLLDLDGTDAWVEGNIFMHAHKNRGTPDSSTAVSGGGDSGNTSEITVIGNLIYDCDGAVNLKEGNFYTLISNTIVHQNHGAGNDTDGAVLVLADDKTTEGAGVYLEGNIIFDAEKLTRNLKTAVVTFAANLMPFPWPGPGMGNSMGDPLFKRVPQVAETAFTNFAQAQMLREWLSLQMGSPARGTGPNGLDQGGVIAVGVSISGEPVGVTEQTGATLVVGVNRTGNAIPTAGWPSGSGYTHYKWRLDTGAWSAETPIAQPIAVSGLGPGAHYIEVTGKRDSGLYQDDPLFGADAAVTRSRAWTVAP